MTKNSASPPHRRKDDIIAFLLYMALIILFYSPVVFGGKSLIPSLYTPHGFVAEGAYARSNRTPVNSFNVDIASPAYYEFPLNKLVGDVYKGGSIPLWNPYQAAGTPLAAQYSTKAFFPYQILEDVSPVWTWDFFMLGRLLVAGFFTYLFLKTMGIGLVPAFGGGLFYMFSGTFVWFISLEQLSNTAMVLPVVMYCVERLAKYDPSRAGGPGPGRQPGSGWRSLRSREVAFTGVSFGLLLLAGQPEVALYGSLLAALYFLVRALKLYGVRGLHLSVIRLTLSYAIGLGLAAPLLLLFMEFVGLSHHIHPAGSSIAFEKLLNWKSIFGYLTPTVTEFPSDPEMISGTSLLVSLKGAWYRFLPLNGVWDTLGGYTGAVPVFVAVAGVMLALTMRGVRRLAHRAELIFFVSFALVILLKNTGVRPFVWIGALPFFDRVWSLRWAGPAFILAISVAGAMGLHAIGAAVDTLKRSRQGGQGRDGTFQGTAKGVSPATAVLMSVALLIGLYTLISFIPAVSMTLQRDTLFNPHMRPYVVPSILYGSIVTVIVMAILFSMLLIHLKGYSARVSILYGTASLAALELWWAVPRGYTPEWLGYKWVPFAVGLVAVFLFYLKKRRAAIAAAAALLVVSFAMDAMSPRGFPERQDPYTPPPYVEYLKGRPGFYRAVGSYGALFPNFASVAALPDLRYVNSLLPSTFHEYRTKYLHAMNYDEDLASTLWFTGRPERIVTDTEIEDPALRFSLRSKPVEDDLLKRLTGYSFMGVRYFVMPKDAGTGLSRVLRAEDRLPLFKIVYDKEVRIYENPFALRRAFVVYEYEYARSFEEAQRTAFNDHFDLRSKAVLETPEAGAGGAEGVAEPLAPGGEGAGPGEGKGEYKAVITGYGPNTVSIDVTTGSDGMLVLTDVYYPGWKALVNGVEGRIYRVNGLVRGVHVKEGASTVVFYYWPASFRAGVVIFLVTVLVCVFISWGGFSPQKPGDTRAVHRLDV